MRANAFNERLPNESPPSSLRRFIAENGAVTVEQAQRLALYHHEFGYYFHKNVIGAEGDFITAPEISQLFGEMVALWCIAQWQAAGFPKSLHLIELGPGKGTLMRDILRVGKRQKGFLESATVSLVEICGRLRSKQKQALLEFPFVFWYRDLKQVPKGADFTIVIANEFFDALPIKQFVGHEERKVCFSEFENDLAFTPPSNPKTVKETCPMGENITRMLMTYLKPGVALIVDYGDDTPPESRFGDTLQAVFRHKPVDALKSLGFADLSHQVDFHSLRKLCPNHRYQSQGNFLLRLGIEKRLEKLMAIATPEQRFGLTTGATRLVAPSEMGQRFKVLEVTRTD